VTTNQISNIPGSLASRLTIIQHNVFPTKYIEDYEATSPLDGVTKVGGLWTFVNGIFVLLFGANVMYFAFSEWFNSLIPVTMDFDSKPNTI
jgi:hypothetical protein